MSSILFDQFIWLNTASPYSISVFEVSGTNFEVDQWAPLGSKSFARSQNRSKFGFSEPWSEASGDVWDGQGWCKTCLYWSPLMFGSVWECLKLIWDNFPLTPLPPTSQQTLSSFLQIMIGTIQGAKLRSAIFQYYDLFFWLRAVHPYSIPWFKSHLTQMKLTFDHRPTEPPTAPSAFSWNNDRTNSGRKVRLGHLSILWPHLLAQSTPSI